MCSYSNYLMIIIFSLDNFFDVRCALHSSRERENGQAIYTSVMPTYGVPHNTLTGFSISTPELSKPRNWAQGENCHSCLSSHPISLRSFDFKQRSCEPLDLRHFQDSLLMGNFQPYIFTYSFLSCSLTLILQRLFEGTKSLFGKNGTVPFGDRFYCEKSILSFLNRKEKGYLCRGTESNHCIRTGSQ